MESATNFVQIAFNDAQRARPSDFLSNRMSDMLSVGLVDGSIFLNQQVNWSQA
ncbi:MAG: hypothetical protein AB4042_00705 [Leptolyngbyaceae cyanobacterium]